MIIALHEGARKRAETAGRGAFGKCPWTDHPVKAHVGPIRQYWAYQGGEPDLPRGYEPESEWHQTWKAPVKDEYCEVILGENREHRADILGANNTIIEIQKSRISLDDCKERIAFYKAHSQKRVIWVVNIQEFWRKRFFLSERRNKDGYYTVTWKPVRSWLRFLAATTDTEVYLEFNPHNENLLKFWVHNKIMTANFVKKKTFFMEYLNDVAKADFQNYSEKAQTAICPEFIPRRSK